MRTEMSTDEKDRERFYRGVGLPAQRASYRQVSRGTGTEIDNQLGSIHVLHKRSLTRLAISHYREVSSELARQFREILLQPLQENEKEEKQWLFDSLRNLELALLALAGK